MVQDTENKHPYKLCEIRTRKGDLKKRWYVEFYVWDENQNQLVRKQDFSMNHLKTAKERLAACEQIKREIDKALIQGKIIRITDTPVIVSDPKATQSDTTPIYISKQSNFIKAIEYCAEVKSASLAKRSGTTYKSICRILIEWLNKKDYQKMQLGQVSPAVMNQFFDYLKAERKVDNITHNNYLVYGKAIFNFYIKREILEKNPCKGISDLPEQEKAHIAFTDKEREEIKSYLDKKDPQLLLFCTFMYYTAVRRNELRLLQIKHIQDGKILVPAYIFLNGQKERVSKNGKSEPVIIANPLQELIEKINLKKYPPEFFIFGQNGEPGPIPLSISYFSNKHAAVIKKLKLSKGHDLYSWKHTGVTKLYMAIKDLKKVKEHCRHHDIRITEKYLRSLGLFDNEEVRIYFPEF